MFQIAVYIEAKEQLQYIGRVGMGSYRAMEKDAVRFDTIQQARLQASYLGSRKANMHCTFTVVDSIGNTMPAELSPVIW